jgi:RNA polymerase sigma-70 factor (ECF subfamily)
MDADVPMAEWTRRFRQGDAQAAEVLFTHYARQLTRLAEQHLSRKLAARLDGEDVVQSVFRTFFRRCAAGEFRIDTSSQLWRLLVRITVLKAHARARHHTAGPRDVRAETGGADVWLSVLATEPGPEEAVTLTEQIEELLAGLPDMYAQVLELRLQGHAVADIAPRLGVSRRTVQRALNLLQERLMRSSGE